jgi:hypothetical protein
MARIAVCGLSTPVSGCSTRSGWSRFSSVEVGAPRGGVRHELVELALARLSSSTFSSCPSTTLTSPTIGTSTSRFLPISAGSTSTWMTLAWGANASSLPVTRSSKRAPRVTSRSVSWNAFTAA